MRKEHSFFKELEEITEYDGSTLDLLRPRLLLAAGIIIVFAILVFCRLWFLQISNNEEFIGKAYNNRVRVRQLVAPRGHLLDRNDIPLVTNRPSFNVLLIRENSNNNER